MSASRSTNGVSKVATRAGTISRYAAPTICILPWNFTCLHDGSLRPPTIQRFDPVYHDFLPRRTLRPAAEVTHVAVTNGYHAGGIYD
jgi:hypothetical protein